MATVVLNWLEGAAMATVVPSGEMARSTASVSIIRGGAIRGLPSPGWMNETAESWTMPTPEHPPKLV